MRILTQNHFRFVSKLLPFLYLRHAGQSTIIQNINQSTHMKMRVNSFDKLAIYEVWGRKVYENRHFTIRPADVIVDIGAHIGAFSVWAAQKAKSGQILAFEPNPDNYALLEENKKLNNLTNIRSYRTAVSKSRGQAKLYTSDYRNTSHSFFEEDARRFALVSTMSLADIFEEHGLKRVNYLKIDAEGAEYAIILNAPTEILQRIDKIFIEYHDYLDHGHSHDDLRKCLVESGFDVSIGANAFNRHLLKLGLIMAHRSPGKSAKIL